MGFLSVLFYIFICYLLQRQLAKAKTHKFYQSNTNLMISGTTREILFTLILLLLLLEMNTIPMVVIFWSVKMTIYRMIDLFLIDYSIIGRELSLLLKHVD